MMMIGIPTETASTTHPSSPWRVIGHEDSAPHLIRTAPTRDAHIIVTRTRWSKGSGRRAHRYALDALPPLGLSQHADQHRPKGPVLLAVDQQLGEGAPERPVAVLPSLEVRE
jgi:hypothetical protein